MFEGNMLDIKALLWLSALALLGFCVVRSIKTREFALQAALYQCQKMNVQLLDQSVFLRRLWVKRHPKGHLALWRAYYFEFTVNGAERYQGRVLMLGRKIERVELEPHRIQ
ncbi:DUF3301 domain-containing protein [Marinimicrobium alkaliphilum]|uniref:DUF3301 domain-containing protein n=1 Tax=Marinimicrobium alkaliphilum TaxID=2202654 RepID=UPI001E527653|nr:DUF3301 domain-containing protein [Marinimicrobium alkaliphilum]